MSGLSADDLSKAGVSADKENRAFYFSVDRITTLHHYLKPNETETVVYTAVCLIGGGSGPPGAYAICEMNVLYFECKCAFSVDVCECLCSLFSCRAPCMCLCVCSCCLGALKFVYIPFSHYYSPIGKLVI